MAYKQKPKPLSKPRQLPKQEHRHYWPYLPAFILIIGLVTTLFLSTIRATHVLGSSEGIAPQGLLASSNTARTRSGVSELTLSTKLTNAAQAKADDMTTRDYWSHETPDGKEPWSFVDAQGYTYQAVGENLAYGFSENQEVINGWLNSQSHRDNLLSDSYTEVGFGVATSENYQDDGPETVVVAVYAKPGSQLARAAAVLGASTGQTNQSFGITRMETLFGASGQTAAFLAGTIATAVAIFLLARHVALLRNLLKQSESFVLHHPMLDVTLISLCIVGVFLAQTSGFVR